MGEDIYAGSSTSLLANGYIGSLPYSIGGGGSCVTISNNNNKMKEEKLKKFKIKYQTTKVVERVIDVMAVDLEDAKKLIEKGDGSSNPEELVSSETNIIE